METILAKKRGPKPSGITKVVYYRRVVPEKVAELDEVIMRVMRSKVDRVEKEMAAVPKVDEVVREPVFDEQKDREIADLKRKLDISCKEYDKLEVKIKMLESEAAIFEKRREAWMAADESAKVRWAINERNQVIALLKKSRSQYDQEVS